MSDNLEKQAYFWRNTEYDLDKMLYEVKARHEGSKNWLVDISDRTIGDDVIYHLSEALNAVRIRYSKILLQQIADWNNKKSSMEDKQ